MQIFRHYSTQEGRFACWLKVSQPTIAMPCVKRFSETFFRSSPLCESGSSCSEFPGGFQFKVENLLAATGFMSPIYNGKTSQQLCITQDIALYACMKCLIPQAKEICRWGTWNILILVIWDRSFILTLWEGLLRVSTNLESSWDRSYLSFAGGKVRIRQRIDCLPIQPTSVPCLAYFNLGSRSHPCQNPVNEPTGIWHVPQ